MFRALTGTITSYPFDATCHSRNRIIFRNRGGKI